DEQRRRGEAQLHERQQRVPAGQELRVLPTLAEQPDRIVDRLRHRVVKRRGDHAAPPSGFAGPEPAEPSPWSDRSERPCSVAGGPSPRPRASSSASQTRSGVSGMSMYEMPSWRSASMTALTIAGVEAIVPASPMPLT